MINILIDDNLNKIKKFIKCNRIEIQNNQLKIIIENKIQDEIIKINNFNASNSKIDNKIFDDNYYLNINIDNNNLIILNILKIKD